MRSRRLDAFAWSDLLWLLALLVLTRLPDLFSHFHDWDEAAMMAEAWAMTKGQLLYRDIAQIHPVLNFAVFTPFFAWLPPDAAPHAIKTMNALLVLGGAWVTRGLVRDWTRDRDCGLAAALLFVALLGRDWALSSYGEFYTIFPILLSAALLERERPAWFSVGLLWGGAFFLKQISVFDMAALAGAALFLRRHPGRASGAAGVALGIGAIFALVAAYFAWHGALADAGESMFLRALDYRSVPGLPLLQRAALFGRLILLPALRDFSPCWFAAAAALAAGRSAAPALFSDRVFRTLLLWFAVALFGVWCVGKMHLHYVLVLVPSACLLAGVCLSAAAPTLRMRIRLALTTLLLITGAWVNVPRLRALAAQDWIDPNVRGSTALAQIVRRGTGPEERIFIYGLRNLDVFYLSERLSANGIYMYLSMEDAFLHKPDLVELHRRRLLERPPTLLIANASPAFSGASPATLAFFSTLLRERYTLTDKLGDAAVYRLRE